MSCMFKRTQGIFDTFTAVTSAYLSRIVTHACYKHKINILTEKYYTGSSGKRTPTRKMYKPKSFT